VPQFARIGLLAAALASAASLARAGAQSAPVPSQIERARTLFLEKLGVAKSFLGDDITNDILERLQDDAFHADDQPPAGMAAADWATTHSNVLRLDGELVDQVVNGGARPLGDIRGLHESFVRSTRDGTNQPIAVLVPATYDATKPAPLIVALHGRPQTESELLSNAVIGRLAESAHAIVIAPWGRGNYDFGEPAASEVYEAVDAVEHAFAIDPHRLYLVGYSMGGFSVFKVAPLGCVRWAGIMSIAGAIVNSASHTYLDRCAKVKLYVVNGGDDDSIPPKFGLQTAQYLASNGVPASFYQEPHGTHALRTLESILDRAWSDMLAGAAHPVATVRGPSGNGLPGLTAPPGTVHPY